MKDGAENVQHCSTNSLETTSLASTDTNTCVICLDPISESAVTIPCSHSFDFKCLGSWLQRRNFCPLCKTEVKGIQYDLDASTGPQVFHLPFPEPIRAAPGRASRITRHSQQTSARRRRRRGQPLSERAEPNEDESLERRRTVYHDQTFSLHVGTNRVSKYQNLTPQLFVSDSALVSRARKWIRRELQVFDFLNPDAPSHESIERRARNAEFLMEYIIAILKSIDIKGSAGQAQELLQDFLGRDHTRLFLHELAAWLRSPYENLKDWDRAVQYAAPET